MICTIVENLKNEFEEADHRVFHHASTVAPNSNVVIRTRDTDLLIVGLGILEQLANNNLWIEIGQFSNNSLEYINVNKIYDHLGVNVCKALPAFHIFTGSDYTAAFSGIGKVKPFRKLIKNKKYIDAFASLGRSETIQALAISCIEDFVCEMYERPNFSSVNEVRFNLFHSKLAKKKKRKNTKQSNFNKEINASSWPPCFSVLYQKILRTNLITNIFISSCSGDYFSFIPELNGWILKDGLYEINWFEGNLSPDEIDIYSTPFQREDDADDDDDLSSNNSSDSECEIDDN